MYWVFIGVFLSLPVIFGFMYGNCWELWFLIVFNGIMALKVNYDRMEYNRRIEEIINKYEQYIDG